MANIAQLSTSNTFGQWVTTTQEVVSKLNNLTDGGNSTVFFANTNFSVANNVTIGGNLTVTGNIVLDEIGFDDLFVNGNVIIGNTLSVTGNTQLSNLQVTGNVFTINVTNTLQVGSNAFIYGVLSVPSSANIGNLNVSGNSTLAQLQITGNVVTLNTTSSAFVGEDLFVYGDTTITGNLVVSGNLTLDNIGFDDLNVAGSGSFGNNISVIGNTQLTGTLDVTGNTTTINTTVTATLNANVFVGNANTGIYDAIAAVQGSSLAFAIALG
jgi:predicted acyltransferase (DUF342 family)